MKTLGAKGLLAAIVLGGACMVGRGGTAPAGPQDTAAATPVAPRRVATGPESRGIPSLTRELNQPGALRPGGPAPLAQRSADAPQPPPREDAVEVRALRRAFEGAPPVMPHSADFGEGIQECRDCHTHGLRLGGRTAHPMSHAPLGQCLQCHVEQEHVELEPVVLTANVFAGFRREAAPETPRPDGVPPTIPHSLSMRGECRSCHGVYAIPGLATTHPERANCVQCHVRRASEPSTVEGPR